MAKGKARAKKEGAEMKLMLGDTYYSNNGRGPGMARIILTYNDMIKFEWKPSAQSRKWRSAELPAAFWNSEHCGWKLRKVKA